MTYTRRTLFAAGGVTLAGVLLGSPRINRTTAQAQERIAVATTIGMIADLVRNTGGDRVEVVHDPDEAGQSVAAARGVRAALARGAGRVLLVPGYCPALDPGEVDALLGAAGALPLAAPPLRAQGSEFPNRAVSMVVAFPPGGQADVVARPVAAALERHWRQPVPVVNRPGASGEVGNASVARAAPDGHTVLFGTNSTHAANPHLIKTMTYDPVKGFTPVTRVTLNPLMLVVRPEVPAKTVREFIDHVKANPAS